MQTNRFQRPSSAESMDTVAINGWIVITTPSIQTTAVANLLTKIAIMVVETVVADMHAEEEAIMEAGVVVVADAIMNTVTTSNTTRIKMINIIAIPMSNATTKKENGTGTVTNITI